jgi:hypothetical protein
MQHTRNRRASLLTAAALVMLSVGAGALPIFTDFPNIHVNLDPNQIFQLDFGPGGTGFSIRSGDGAAIMLDGSASYDPAAGLGFQQRVQEGFVLLDGTLSLAIDARKPDGTRARTLTTYGLEVRRRALRPEHLARTLMRQGVVRDPIRALTRARAMRRDDARVMRLVEKRDGARWIRAVRAIRDASQRAFRPRTRPDGVLGHFGFAQSDGGDPHVWAVIDRNSSKYAVGLTVDRDGDGVPNAADNCVGTRNPNQGDTDADSAGDDCDLDDDNDSHADVKDNCPLKANPDQSDQDLDGAGDACDADDDNDGVLDGSDACQATALGSLVSANGCSIADTCPCDGNWRNHGAYVKCVAQTSNSFVSAGLITSAQRNVIVSAGAKSVCGF